jgi:hypothetical protein
MSFDPAGLWGIRQRLRIALAMGYSYATLETLLYVAAATLEAYVTDPTYVLEPTDVALIVDNLFNVQVPDLFYDERKISPNVTIWYVESVYWTDEQLDNLMVPEGVSAFKVHFLSESEEHRPMSTPLYPYPAYDPASVARSAVGGDLQRLVCIVFYQYNNVEA